jgi:NAD-dependent dihydropyrimidine dehydrogenase PreA subunit
MQDHDMKKKHTVVISRDECKGCGRCVDACPRGVLAMADTLNLYGFPFAAPVNPLCIGCGSCFYACPEPGAITVLEEADDEGNEDNGERDGS